MNSNKSLSELQVSYIEKIIKDVCRNYETEKLNCSSDDFSVITHYTKDMYEVRLKYEVPTFTYILLRIHL